MTPIFKFVAIVALSSFSVLGSPIEQAEGVADFAPTLETRSNFTPLEKRADFQWRFCESAMLELWFGFEVCNASTGIVANCSY